MTVLCTSADLITDIDLLKVTLRCPEFLVNTPELLLCGGVGAPQKNKQTKILLCFFIRELPLSSCNLYMAGICNHYIFRKFSGPPCTYLTNLIYIIRLGENKSKLEKNRQITTTFQVHILYLPWMRLSKARVYLMILLVYVVAFALRGWLSLTSGERYKYYEICNDTLHICFFGHISGKTVSDL